MSFQILQGYFFVVFLLLFHMEKLTAECLELENQVIARESLGRYEKVYSSSELTLLKEKNKDHILQIFDHQFNKLHDEVITTKLHWRKQDPLAYTSKLRAAVFNVQALARAYRRVYNEGTIVKIIREELAKYKALEDTIGDLRAQGDFLAHAQLVQAPQKVMAVLEQKFDKSVTAFEKLLNSHDWQPDKKGRLHAIKTTRSLLAENHKYLLSNKKNRENLALSIAHELEKNHRDPLDMSNLEDGGHEARRRWRWMSFYIMSFAGVIRVTEDRGQVRDPVFLKFLTDPLHQDSRYLPKDYPLNIVPPLYISRPYVLRLNRLVKGMGDVKDIGESVHFLAEAYVEAGLASHLEAATMMVHQHGLQHGMNYRAKTEAIINSFQYPLGQYHKDPVLDFFFSAYKEVLDTELLLRIAQELRNH